MSDVIELVHPFPSENEYLTVNVPALEGVNILFTMPLPLNVPPEGRPANKTGSSSIHNGPTELILTIGRGFTVISVVVDAGQLPFNV